MSSILIVEDEQHLADGLCFNLRADGHDVEIATDGAQALRVALDEARAFDAIVLDVMLPEVDGFAVATRLRAANNFTPILMLTARGHAEDVLQGFAAGADDYLPKPFDLQIFLARLHGLLRRKQWFITENTGAESDAAPLEKTTVYEINGRTIDLPDLEIRNSATQETVKLTLMEARLLQFLLETEGKAIARKTILEEVWGLRDDTDTRAIDNFIVRLRRYLEDDPAKPQILQTVRGVGYRFVTGAQSRAGKA